MKHTYTAVHAKHGTKTVEADSTYGAAKKAASHWNTGKKGTQGIDVHLHTDKPKAYSEDYDVTDISSHKDGYNAAKSGKKYSDNPHPKGSQAHLNWSKGHNQARANKTMGEDVVTYTHKDTGAKMKSKFITDVAAKNFVTQLKSQQHKNIEHHKEEVDLEEGHFEITYTNPQFSKPQTHTMKAKNADHAQTKFLSYGNPYKVHSVKKVQKEDADVPALLKGFKTFEEGYYKDIATKKAEDERLAKQKKTNYPPHMDELLKKARAYDKKHPIPKNEAVTKTIKPGQGYKMEEVTEELKFKGLTTQDKKRMTKMNTVPTKPVMNKPGRQVAKHKDVVVHHHQGVGHVYKNHKHIASGDYDEGAGGYFMSKHGDKKGGQKFFDNEHKVAKHYAESIEESALTRVMNKLKDVETKKSFATGQSRIPTPDERRKQLSKKASVVKEAAKKKKQKPETFEAEPELSSEVQIKGQ